MRSVLREGRAPNRGARLASPPARARNEDHHPAVRATWPGPHSGRKKKTMGHAIEANEESLKNAIEGGGLVLVDFW
ncbi:MAG: hypothetical protein KC586_31610, partial [Myxococcales bacterium]|nr:hypothetical protein [Myxococcales bacterium]